MTKVDDLIVDRLIWGLGFYASRMAYLGDNQRNDGCDPYTSKDSPYILSVGRDGGNLARAILAEFAIASTPSVQWDECDHDWVEKIDGFSSSESQIDLKCAKCGCPGAKDQKTGDVFWPAT